MKCEYCGAVCERTRSSQRFCSASCRAKWHKEKSGVPATIYRADRMKKYTKIILHVAPVENDDRFSPGTKVTILGVGNERID